MRAPNQKHYWLTNPDLDKLLSEAKTYLETSIWIKNTRANLLERYQPYAVRLGSKQVSRDAAGSFSLGQTCFQLSTWKKANYLAKREKLLAFIRSTQLASRKWRETSQALAPLLGLDGGDLTVTQLKQLSRMALLCFADDKPEPQWFDAKYLEQVQETVVKAKQLYQEHNLLKSRLEKLTPTASTS